MNVLFSPCLRRGLILTDLLLCARQFLSITYCYCNPEISFFMIIGGNRGSERPMVIESVAQDSEEPVHSLHVVNKLKLIFDVALMKVTRTF